MEELLSYIPKAAHIQIESFLRNMDVNIIVTKQRLTKHGDFRFHPNKKSIITVNNSLNPYRFLITLLHELAHFKVSRQSGNRVKPHGLEWKRAFQETLLPFLNPTIFPEPICTILAKHMKNPKASSDRDFDLVMALKKYDEQKEQQYIFEIQDGVTFSISNGRRFVKIKKRRKRIECKEIETGRIYLFSPHAEIQID
ncbi:ImmA/IrrE family metallo-endopeptidase [Flavobacteriaceae bacterium]|nr:ImmA/IrrE family metallo-endopeptidase [Flavobacteriaceae bacterium]